MVAEERHLLPSVRGLHQRADPLPDRLEGRVVRLLEALHALPAKEAEDTLDLRERLTADQAGGEAPRGLGHLDHGRRPAEEQGRLLSRAQAVEQLVEDGFAIRRSQAVADRQRGWASLLDGPDDPADGGGGAQQEGLEPRRLGQAKEVRHAGNVYAVPEGGADDQQGAV